MDDRALVLTTVEDLVADLLYYDRKDDEDLPRGRIEELIADGTLTVEDLVRRFERHLKEALGAD